MMPGTCITIPPVSLRLLPQCYPGPKIGAGVTKRSYAQADKAFSRRPEARTGPG
jgi:hypothetical protein